MNSKVTLIIPVRREADMLIRCLKTVQAGTMVPEIIVMDCTADVKALDKARKLFRDVRFFDFGMNPGRAHAANTGIHITQTPYVMTLSPRLLVGKHCVEKLCGALEKDSTLFSAQAGILSAEDPSRISGAGWLVDLTASPVVRGVGSKASRYRRRAGITAAQMDAAIYRMEYLEATGIFDERFYCRLEDLDLGYRAVTAGFRNAYVPGAVCREMKGEPDSSFYRQLERGNLEYFRYKYGLKGPKAPKGEADPEIAAALERGRMLCFQAEIEQMEREQMGMTVTKQTLPEEFYMEIQKDGPHGVFPLYLGERSGDSLLQNPSLVRARAGMLAGSARKLWDKIPLGSPFSGRLKSEKSE